MCDNIENALSGGGTNTMYLPVDLAAEVLGVESLRVVQAPRQIGQTPEVPSILDEIAAAANTTTAGEFVRVIPADEDPSSRGIVLDATFEEQGDTPSEAIGTGELADLSLPEEVLDRTDTRVSDALSPEPVEELSIEDRLANVFEDFESRYQENEAGPAKGKKRNQKRIKLEFRGTVGVLLSLNAERGGPPSLETIARRVREMDLIEFAPEFLQRVQVPN